MDWIVVEGVRPYDGRYEFDLAGQAFTVREWGWIKRHAGYLPFTFWEGLQGSDAELLAVMAIVAMVRAGKVSQADVPDVWERFQDAPGVVTVQLELADREDDSDPLLPESSNGSEIFSGNGSETSSGSSEPAARPTGTPASAISGSLPARPWAT